MQFAKILCGRRNCIHVVSLYRTYICTNDWRGKTVVVSAVCVSCAALLISGFESFQPAVCLVITVVVIGPETAAALVQLRHPCNLPAKLALKPGDFPRHIRHLHRRRYILGFLHKNGDYPWNSPGGRPARRALAIALHGICPIRPTPGLSMRSSCNVHGRRRRFFAIGKSAAHPIKKKLARSGNDLFVMSVFFISILLSDDFIA